VIVLVFEEAQKMRVFWGQGVPPLAALEGGSTLREQGRSFLVVMKAMLLNTAVFFIYEIVKRFTEPRGFKEKAT
jgi:hypothetical protein